MTTRYSLRFGSRHTQPTVELPKYVIISRGDAGVERLILDRIPNGDVVVRCFLSPLDALIEATCLARSGELHAVISTHAIDRETFGDRRGKSLSFAIHQNWIARNGRIVLRPSGAPASHCDWIRKWPRGRFLTFDVDADFLERYGEMYLKAGLFAWRETLQDVARWDGQRLRETVEVALGTMPAGGRMDPGPEQSALFDPEFKQWHFVPCS